MPNLPNFSVAEINAIGIIAATIMLAFPILVLVYGILLGLARRRPPLEERTARRGWIVLSLCLAAIGFAVGGSAVVREAEVAGYVLYGVLELLLLTAFIQIILLRRQPLGRPLRFGSGALLASSLLLVICVPFGIYLARISLEITAYSNFDEAEVRAVLAKNPRDPAAHSSLAQIESLRNDHAGAIVEWQQGLAAEPDNEMALFMLGSELTRAHQPEQARPLYQKLASGNGAFRDSAQKWLARHGG